MDRLLIFKVNKWRTLYFTRQKAAYTGLVLTIFIYLVNSNVIFTYGFVLVTNDTNLVECFTTETISSTRWMNDWNTVSNNFWFIYILWLEPTLSHYLYVSLTMICLVTPTFYFLNLFLSINKKSFDELFKWWPTIINHRLKNFLFFILAIYLEFKNLVFNL